MKHLRKFNESIDNKIFVSGSPSYSSPFSSSGLSISKHKKQRQFKDVPGEFSIHFQTNEGGVVINDVSKIDEIINFLMEVKDTLY